VLAYAPGSNTWVPAAAMVKPMGYLPAVTAADGRIFTMGGFDQTGILDTVEAYGPLAKLSTASGKAGAKVKVTGSNFAANASVKVYWGPANGGSVLAVGKTGATGKIAAISITVPTGTKPGSYSITTVDLTSHYPSTMTFKVTG
jgi:hypothetical protein